MTFFSFFFFFFGGEEALTAACPLEGEAFGGVELCFFRHTVSSVWHFTKAKVPFPMKHLSPCPKRQWVWCRCIFFFLPYHSVITTTHHDGNTALFSSCKDALKPSTSPSRSHLYGLMKIMNSGHGEGTGCHCANRAGVQVASPLGRGARGQETCGAPGAEEKVVSLDSVFLMTCMSMRKAGGYRKRLSLTAPGGHGKPPLCLHCSVKWVKEWRQNEKSFSRLFVCFFFSGLVFFFFPFSYFFSY